MLNIFSKQQMQQTKKDKNMTNNTNRTKTLTRDAMIKNINGLSEGDRAYCGPYGTITCVRGSIPYRKRGARRFKVTNSSKIANGGNYSMKALRKAICA